MAKSERSDDSRTKTPASSGPRKDDPTSGWPEYARLGFGAYSHPIIEQIVSRRDLFSAMRKLAKPELNGLREACLPLYTVATDRNPPNLGGHFPVVVARSDAGGIRREWAHTVSNWLSLYEGANHAGYLYELKRELEKWAKRHHLTDQWMLDSILRNLCMWANQKELAQELYWTYPGSRGGGKGSPVDISGLTERVDHRPPDLGPAPQCDPITETLDEYLARCRNHWEKHSRVLESWGFRKVKEKRTLLHFEWVVRYQIQNWAHRKIADFYDDKIRTESAIGVAVRDTAKLIGLTLREGDKGGRPSKHSR